ncbi:unnamed protein product, partial [Rotaria sp. Silwood2]
LKTKELKSDVPSAKGLANKNDVKARSKKVAGSDDDDEVRVFYEDNVYIREVFLSYSQSNSLIGI